MHEHSIQFWVKTPEDHPWANPTELDMPVFKVLYAARIIVTQHLPSSTAAQHLLFPRAYSLHKLNATCSCAMSL
jgi:hypothetical protein